MVGSDTNDTPSIGVLTLLRYSGLMELPADRERREILNSSFGANYDRSIVQALNIQDNAKANKFSQILQLPGVELEKLDTKQNILTLGKLLKKPTIEPSKFLNLDKEKTEKVLDYAASIDLTPFHQEPTTNGKMTAINKT